MNVQVNKCPTPAGRIKVPGAASCGVAIRGVQITHRTANQAADRYCYATHGWQLQQWPAVSVVAVPVRREGMDKQKHHQTRLDGSGGARAHLLYPQREDAQCSGMVRRYLGAATPSCRDGCWATIATSWRVHPLAAEKHRALPQNRTYGFFYKPQNRTCSLTHRPQNRTYTGCFRAFPMPHFRTPSRNAIYTGFHKGSVMRSKSMGGSKWAEKSEAR